MGPMPETVRRTETCGDYRCEWNGQGDHSHVGVKPWLRRVVGPDRKIIDGKTGEVLSK